jgi:ABC-type bacteriocin/lantibiotic exporter with double-glycine peptidase domain
VENVTFRYDGSEVDVIKDFSHDFKPGSITAIVGMTGRGKSTLSRLILSLLRPASGEITLYDGSGSYKSDAGTRCNFMYVPQGNSLLSGSIRNNLLLANPDATDDEMMEALHVADADFVLDLPEGLDSVCAETGGGLSEGQAQRIAIARAMLRPGGILIMDEASSSLDSITERRIMERISERCRGKKTVIFITHREAMLGFADECIEL